MRPNLDILSPNDCFTLALKKIIVENLMIPRNPGTGAEKFRAENYGIK